MTVAWVTGGGTGIGRALAEGLYRQGARVVITGRRKEVLELACHEITSRPSSGELLTISGDAADPAHVSDVLTQVRLRWGPLDLLINNAGINFNHDVSETSVEEYRGAFEGNCLSAIRATTATLPDMLKSGRGAIVNISSIYGKWASAQSASYSVSKYALAGYTDALRQSLEGTPVHVLGVYPGFIKTNMTLPFVQAGSMKSRLGRTPEQMSGAILKALRHKRANLYYPWYVPWALRMARWMPVWSNRLAQRVKR